MVICRKQGSSRDLRDSSLLKQAHLSCWHNAIWAKQDDHILSPPFRKLSPLPSIHMEGSGGASVELAWITCPGTEEHDWDGPGYLPIILSREQATYTDSPKISQERSEEPRGRGAGQTEVPPAPCLYLLCFFLGQEEPRGRPVLMVSIGPRQPKQRGVCSRGTPWPRKMHTDQLCSTGWHCEANAITVLVTLIIILTVTQRSTLLQLPFCR